MATNTEALVATMAIVGLGGLFLFTARRDRATALRGEPKGAAPERDSGQSSGKGREVERAAVLQRRGATAVAVESNAPPAVRSPMDPETLEVTRRQFLNRGVTGFFALGLGAFGASSLAFLWPSLSGGFGAKVTAGKLEELLDEINTKREPVYVPEGRTWITTYPKEALGAAKGVYTGAVLAGMQQGIVALYQKCPHLGCRVPWCNSSQWFECPCHGSQYNRVGEKKGGPAPRGMDRFGVEIQGGTIVVDTSTVVQGPAIGTDTTGQEAEGPHCA
ncbi:MAG TPA: ubiquinol-cytochrome c reductase iron-sulfur subunit [Acidimicrobiales bacterium]|nr:ubiquinol-cytochrome c reductase iron-sulfur subunit [Acidimicrobiales bacterium]